MRRLRRTVYHLRAGGAGAVGRYQERRNNAAVRAVQDRGRRAIGRLVLERLAQTDDVTYLRFASVYKAFQGLGDFQAELGRLSKVSD